MLSENRKFHFIAELNLKKSRVLTEDRRPMDDEVNWLFLKVGARQFSFVYRIRMPSKSEYESPFTADLAFTMIEAAERAVEIGNVYEVFRGDEMIGTVRLVSPLAASP